MQLFCLDKTSKHRNWTTLFSDDSSDLSGTIFYFRFDTDQLDFSNKWAILSNVVFINRQKFRETNSLVSYHVVVVRYNTMQQQQIELKFMLMAFKKQILLQKLIHHKRGYDIIMMLTNIE